MAIITAAGIRADLVAPGVEIIEVRNPINGEVIGAVPQHRAADVVEAIRRGRAAQPAWAALPHRDRARIFLRFHDLILQRREEIFNLIQLEAGKSRRDAFVEVFAIASETRYYALRAGRFLRSRRLRGAIPLREYTTLHYHPVGVVGIISPWNFPFILGIADAIPALLAGNAVVTKPATQTPLSALWARDRLLECGLPADILQMITGPGDEIGGALIDHADYLMFTGSTETGKKVAARAAGRLIPYSMELGGKNAVIVLPDAALDHAVRIVIEGTFNNAGQACINFERAYVHDAIYDRFVSALVRETRRLRLGCGFNYDHEIGSLISPDEIDFIEGQVREAVAGGARVLTGGRRSPEHGLLFYEPTILEGVQPGMAVYAEETFGPVISVYRFSDIEDAIQRANDSRYGLHFAVISGNRREAERIAGRLKAGTVAVNDSYAMWAAMDAPMGGFKESGVGRRHGPEGIRKFTEVQAVVTNRTPWQIGSSETALSINRRLAELLIALLRVWRYIPFLR